MLAGADSPLPNTEMHHLRSVHIGDEPAGRGLETPAGRRRFVEQLPPGRPGPLA